ncbi:hypothetical protein [Sphingomonas kyeonggiensis]|uniref:Uncharacterized protein n=1 Tax=Sphingomonas kyeonggiensis TaxID=1268553 RepID=A0A7W6JQ69_9SPHN|nr:hypothetical protein [Sphingomonas kyeonggiensis]MBB4097453.1 hypothetical protein [Sphingomonas kyeonggiensis]
MTMKHLEERWFRTDEASDVAGSVRHAIRSAPLVQQDPQAIKWLMLALHSALQGACVCHLTTTAQPFGALAKKSADEWWRYLNGGNREPDAKQPAIQIMALPDLLKAIRKPNSIGSGAQEPGIVLSDVELAWLRRLHDQIRNQFIHFAPMGWSIEISGVPEFGSLVGRIIVAMLDGGWAFRRLERDEAISLRHDAEHLRTPEWLTVTSTTPDK